MIAFKFTGTLFCINFGPAHTINKYRKKMKVIGHGENSNNQFSVLGSVMNKKQSFPFHKRVPDYYALAIL
jgi:hypothetical protein